MVIKSMNTLLAFIAMLHSTSLHVLANVTISLSYFNFAYVNCFIKLLVITLILVTTLQFSMIFPNLCFFNCIHHFKAKVNFPLYYFHSLLLYLLAVESHKQTLPMLTQNLFQLNPFQFQVMIHSFHIFINYYQQNQHYKEILYTLKLSR